MMYEDAYGYPEGCRDVTHLRDCGKCLSLPNIIATSNEQPTFSQSRYRSFNTEKLNCTDSRFKGLGLGYGRED